MWALLPRLGFSGCVELVGEVRRRKAGRRREREGPVGRGEAGAAGRRTEASVRVGVVGAEELGAEACSMTATEALRLDVVAVVLGVSGVRRTRRGGEGRGDSRVVGRGCVRHACGRPARADLVEVLPACPDQTQLAQPGGLVGLVVVTASALAQQGGEAVAQAALDGDGLVHVHGVLAHAEEEEDEHAHDGGDVAVEGDDALLRQVDDDVPGGRVVHFGPAVGGPGDGDVDAEEEDGEGGVDDDEGDGGDEEAQEARRVEGLRAEDGGDAGAVAAETEYHEDWVWPSAGSDGRWEREA